MLSGLSIQALDKQQDQQLATTVPKLPFSLYLAASKGQGKSTTLLNLLLNRDLLGGKFSQIFYISETALLDSKTDMLRNTKGITKVNKPLLKKLKQKDRSGAIFGNDTENPDTYDTRIPPENFIEDVSIDLLKQLIAEQKSIIKRYGKEIADHILLVYDDCITAEKFWKSRTVAKMLMNSRHVKISVIITSQSYKMLPKALRLNMSLLALFNTSNLAELKQIYEEHSSSVGWKRFQEIFIETTEKKPYNSLVINYQGLPKNRLQSAFESVI